MEQENIQTSGTTKLPILKQVAQTVEGSSTPHIPGPVTTNEKIQKKNDMKAKSILLMALLNEHMMTFDRYKDAKSLFDAKTTIFSGNNATRKTQTTLLKQMYENFSAQSTESLDFIFNRHQKIVSQLAVLGESISQKTLNLKIFRILPSEWNTHVVVWRNKSDLDKISIDYLYNNLKIVKQEVKRNDGPSSSSGSQNMAFVSTPSTSNNDDVSAIFGVSTSYMADDEAPTNMAFVAFSDSEESEGKDKVESPPEIERKTVKPSVDKVKVDIAKKMTNLLGDQSNMLRCTEHKDLGARCKYHQREKMVNGTNHSGVNHSANTVPKAVLTRTGLKPVNTVRHVNPKSTRRSFQRRTSYNNRNFYQKVNTTKGKVNTARPNSAVLNVVRVNKGKAVKASTCWFWRPIKLDSESIVLKKHTYIEARARSKSEFVREYVAFGGGAKGGKDTGKGIIRTGKLDFEVVYFVKELKFNLFSILQTCDRKNSVLFTNTECFVLSPDFKLANESHVLLKVPRKNNMYSVDMKNIVPKKDLTCLVAKDTNDESMLWHRRLGHINFKNINKLVKENLVRGLPSKCFENDQTCVACLKGKQHKVSFKFKIQNSITQPLFMLHMDLFGPTFNRVMNEFCKGKGIKREYSVARTPQKNGIAERKNRTLIEEARTMLADSKLPTTFWAEAVNTACYVQNRVLVVKPHFKTPYELFRCRTPTISFMRPFGCHVTILNTLDHLGKFDGKSNEGFFVGYFTNNKSFRVYNTRNRKVEENLHINFLENKPIIKGQYSMETGPSQDYILMPLWNDSSLFDTSLKDSDGDNKDNDGPSKESEIDNQERPNAKNNTKDVNTARPSINTARLNINIASPTVNIVRLSDDFFGAINDIGSLDRVEVDISIISIAKRIFRYLKGQPKLGLWYPRDSPFDLVSYTDSDYARASLDRKSTSGGCQFLRCRLISWQCKKQTLVATSTTEAEYVAVASCYGQVL
nr:ribonuclease H-like domain-containing protein [Tanacetum cinerariifolium]